jgi:hypothetical protein
MFDSYVFNSDKYKGTGEYKPNIDIFQPPYTFVTYGPRVSLVGSKANTVL